MIGIAVINKGGKMNDITKKDMVIDLLLSMEGATIDDIQDATAWQENTIRSFLSSTLKKLGYTVTRAKRPDGKTAYFIE
jgi:hypothetical protein